MSKTISFKLSESDTQKLLTLLPSLPSESIHTAAKCLMMFSLLALTSSPTPAEAEEGNGGIASQYKLLALEADLHQVNLSLEQVVESIEKLALYLSTLSELLLINVGNVSGEAASEAVSEMYQLIFETRD